MAATFTSNQVGGSADYIRYIHENPVKTDRVGDVDLLDFALAPIDSNFVRIPRGAYITLTTSTYGVWFTGYVSNDPEYTYLGEDSQTKQPVWGFRYQAESDEVILSEQSLGILPPFLNMTQGQILASLANTLLPGWFDTTGIQAGQRLARYVVDPTKKFADIVKEFTQNAVYRFWAKNGQLFYAPQDASPSSVVIDPTDIHFTPDQLDIRASKQGIVNDAIVLGGTEPQEYVSEYFVGDGATGQFPLLSSVFGVESAVLLDETFGSSSLSGGNWTVYDLPSSKLQISNGFLNVLGGSADGNFNVHLDSSSLIPVEGNLRLTHGDYDFVDAATTTGLIGVVGALWSQAPNKDLVGCLCGFAVVRDSTGTVTLQTVANGSIVNTSYQTINMQRRYVLRTILSLSSLNRTATPFNYLTASGQVYSIPSDGSGNPLPGPITVGGAAPGGGGGGNPPDQFTVTFMISEIDPTYGMITDTTTYPKYDFHTLPVPSNTYALYVPAASSDLHCTITNITVSTPMQAALEERASGNESYTPRLIGPNEVDALDGVTPVATISQSGGITKQSSTLGSPQYNASGAALTYFKDSVKLQSTIPGVADTIHLKYRKAGAAIGRARDNVSVLTEAANWQDSGVRSQTRNNLSPLPKTSAQCEAAAAAIVGELGHTRYEGTYKVWSDYTTSEPVAGTVLSFQNMPLGTFGAQSFGESVYQVKSTFVSAKPHELFLHEVSFGKATDQEQLRKTLSGFQSQPDVFYPQDSAAVPDYVLPSSVGLAYAPDVLHLSLVSFDANNFYVTALNDPPAGGGLEVRSTNDSWGSDPGKNLVLRSSTKTFTIPRTQHNTVAFVKAYDIRNQLLYSEDFTTAAWNGAIATQVNALTPKGRFGPVGVIPLSGPTYISQAVAAANSATSYPAAFTISLKGSKGAVATVYMTDENNVDYAAKDVVCTGHWQRVTVSATITPSGANNYGMGGYNTGPYGGVQSRFVICGVRTNTPLVDTLQLTMASLENFTTVETMYAKTNGTPYGAVSRYASAVRFNFPLVPPPPLTVAVNPSQTGQVVGTDPTVPPGIAAKGMVVTPTLPLVAEDVWGFEIRASDNSTVLYHCDLTSSSYQPSVTLTMPSRNNTYYVYTYNLFGEYSSPYIAAPNMGPPTVSSVVVNNVTQLLLWQYTNATQFRVQADTVDETFTHLAFDVTVQTNFLALEDVDFYNFRWFRVTPMDAFGSGTPVDIGHQYAPGAVDTVTSTNYGSWGTPGAPIGVVVIHTGPTRPLRPGF